MENEKLLRKISDNPLIQWIVFIVDMVCMYVCLFVLINKIRKRKKKMKKKYVV